MELSITICETLIVDSYFAKNEIANILKLNKDKIKVIYLGIDRKFLSSENSKSLGIIPFRAFSWLAILSFPL